MSSKGRNIKDCRLCLHPCPGKNYRTLQNDSVKPLIPQIELLCSQSTGDNVSDKICHPCFGKLSRFLNALKDLGNLKGVSDINLNNLICLSKKTVTPRKTDKRLRPVGTPTPDKRDRKKFLCSDTYPIQPSPRKQKDTFINIKPKTPTKIPQPIYPGGKDITDVNLKQSAATTGAKRKRTLFKDQESCLNTATVVKVSYSTGVLHKK